MVYHDVTLARFPGGRVGVEEMVRLTDGERLTDLIRREMLPAAALRDPGVDARLEAEDRLVLAHAAKVADLDKARRDRKWKELIAAYDALPPGLQDRKAMRFQHARACLYAAGRADQEAALAACRERFPGDLATELLALDFHFKHNEYAAALRAAAGVRAAVGEDAMLDAIEALVLAKVGKVPAGGRWPSGRWPPTRS